MTVGCFMANERACKWPLVQKHSLKASTKFSKSRALIREPEQGINTIPDTGAPPKKKEEEEEVIQHTQ